MASGGFPVMLPLGTLRHPERATHRGEFLRAHLTHRGDHVLRCRGRPAVSSGTDRLPQCLGANISNGEAIDHKGALSSHCVDIGTFEETTCWTQAMCEFTDGEGDKMYAKASRAGGAGGQGEYLSGTGRWAGMAGSGTYKMLGKFPTVAPGRSRPARKPRVRTPCREWSRPWGGQDGTPLGRFGATVAGAGDASGGTTGTPAQRDPSGGPAQAPKACSRSAHRSSTFSRPTDKRSRSSVTPISSRT